MPEDIEKIKNYIREGYNPITAGPMTKTPKLSRGKIIERLNKKIKRLKGCKNSGLKEVNHWARLAIDDIRRLMKLGLDAEELEQLVNKYYSAIEFKFEEIAEINLEKYNEYVRNTSNPLSLDELINENLKNKNNVFIDCGADITAIIERVLVPRGTKEKIIEAIPENPWDAYPSARAMHRHFILHIGGTNTGKTYQSLQRLKEVSSGVYLGPLRLLAMEVYENLNLDGVPCSLLTGEQEDDIPGAKHVASTIEMANFSAKYDVAVIDECQMLTDRDRGGNWTEAIMGIQAPEIHLCMAAMSKDICIKIIEDCGDTYEIVEHERFVPLLVESRKKVFDIKKDLKPGDALILFSRRAVLEMAQILNDTGIKASVIYGALPYETRKKQVERFVNKETEVVVSTDAIGMGLNLPIHRIVFMEMSKFDGTSVRRLNGEEIRQIAGRAGRRGMYEEGYVTAANPKDIESIRNAINTPSAQIKSCFINFPESLVDLDFSLQNVIKTWKGLSQKKPYIKQKMDIMVELMSLVGNREKASLTHKELFDVCTVPLDNENWVQVAVWNRYITQYVNKNKNLDKPRLRMGIDKLKSYEEYYKILGIYFYFAKKMGMKYDKEWLDNELKETAEKINELLLEAIKVSRRCAVCKKPLPMGSKYALCKDCYYGQKMARWDNDWNDYF